jgi:ribosomal protein S18 acetylase RimI-like enzyme
VTYRAWAIEDRERCLAIFDGNLPRFFTPADRVPFVEFLSRPVGFYGVLADAEGKLVGCGGVAPDRTGRVAILTWGMVDAAHHRRGWGRRLALVRLRRALAMPAVEVVRVNTSSETVGFYERLGFRTFEITPHGYRPGLHRHDMELTVDAALRLRLGAAEG